MKKLSELAAEVYQSRNNPGMLAEVHITLATVYSNLNEEMMECQLKKADFWQSKDYEDKSEKVFATTNTEGGVVLCSNYPDCGHYPGQCEKRWTKREKPLSDTAVEMMWLQTEDGRKEIKLKYTLRSLEKLMQACKSSMVNSAIEAKNI